MYLYLGVRLVNGT